MADFVAIPPQDLLEPTPDLHVLFLYYNDLYFDGKLNGVTVSWSTKRMTLCAGICSFDRGGYCQIRLSEPLLKFRSSKEMKETLLHEMIHALLFVTGNNKDHDDHGPIFQSHMTRINTAIMADMFRPSEGYEISIYHTFHDEVDFYRVHWWKCNRCDTIVKRSMNRPPSEKDCFRRRGKCESCPWHAHLKKCGGEYIKIKEPERPKKKTTGRKKKGEETSDNVTANNKKKRTKEEEAKPWSQSVLDKFFTKGKELTTTAAAAAGDTPGNGGHRLGFAAQGSNNHGNEKGVENGDSREARRKLLADAALKRLSSFGAANPSPHQAPSNSDSASSTTIALRKGDSGPSAVPPRRTSGKSLNGSVTGGADLSNSVTKIGRGGYLGSESSNSRNLKEMLEQPTAEVVVIEDDSDTQAGASPSYAPSVSDEGLDNTSGGDYQCPVCDTPLPSDLAVVNAHVDACVGVVT